MSGSESEVRHELSMAEDHISDAMELIQKGDFNGDIQMRLRSLEYDIELLMLHIREYENRRVTVTPESEAAK